jgi:rsbT antagonist protein RsbS
MAVSILKHERYLIVTIQPALTDEDLLTLQTTLVEKVGKFRSRGVIVDMTAMDVLDSFASLMVRNVANIIRLRGAETVIVGVQPQVAFAMVRLGITLARVRTALDLDEGLAYLEKKLQHDRAET